jgi:YVTN family beta-propeller protein
VAAAVDAQRDLAAFSWPEGAEVKVRMGLHTGEPKVGAERYVGIGVHRAARIGAAGHGGQVLLSSTTRELAEEDLPPGITIRNLGQRRLKDIEQPQHLYQLVIEGLQNDFAQLRTLDVELKRKRRRMYAGSALIGVIAAAVAIPLFALGQGNSGSGLHATTNSLAQIDPNTNKVVATVANVGARPASISYGSGSLWVANLDDNTVARVDPQKRAVIRTIPVAATQTGVAAGPAGVWISNGAPGSVSEIDLRYNTVARPIRVTHAAVFGIPQTTAVAIGSDAVWVASDDGTVSRVDPARNTVVETAELGCGPVAIAVGAGAVWVACSGYPSGNVRRIDPTGATATIPVGHTPSAIAVGYGAIWVADSADDTVTRISPETYGVTARIPVGKSPIALAIGAGAVWVANSGDGTVSRIDPKSGHPKTITVGASTAGLAFAGGSLWVTVATGTLNVGAQGGTARIVVGFMDYTDPALAYSTQSWQLDYATCAKLLNYPDKPAPAGSQLVPEVAKTLPAVSNHGKTYTFTIRKGFHFSPPSTEPVTAQSFKYAIERSQNPRMVAMSGRPEYLDDVVGEKAYAAGKARHIAGVIAKGNTLTIRLTRPNGDLPARLSMPFFCAIPLGTPLDPKGLPTIPSPGPYYIASYTP